MKRIVLCVAALAAVSTVLAGFKYEGEWGTRGTGNGQFNKPLGVDVAPNGNVYVADSGNDRFQYFTADGSFLGKWSYEFADGLAIAPNGNVYAGGCYNDNSWVRYFTPTGSLIGSWKTFCEYGDYTMAGDVASDRKVYVIDGGDRISYWTGSGSLLGSWSGPGLVWNDAGIAPDGEVYLTGGFGGQRLCMVMRYTPNGSFLGSWGSWGYGPGQFDTPMGVDVAPNGHVFVADSYNDRVQYFTASGSLLGEFGKEGGGPGGFINPWDVAFSPTTGRVYVADRDNHRIQYFTADNPTVRPTSLGKVKAVFR